MSGYLKHVQEVIGGGEADPLQLVLDALLRWALEPLRVVTHSPGWPGFPITLPGEDRRSSESEALQTTAGLAGRTPTSMLSNLIPASRRPLRSCSTAGESFRGAADPSRHPTGCLSSNPLRDRSPGRLSPFGMDVVERRGGGSSARNATQGLGATGGLVELHSRSPPPPVRDASSSAFPLHHHEATASRGTHRSPRPLGYGREGLGASTPWFLQVESRWPPVTTGRGAPSAIDNVQGDCGDSGPATSYVNRGWEPDGRQADPAFLSDSPPGRRKGASWSVAGDRAAGIPATSIEGDPRGTEPVNDVTTASLELEDRDFLGGALSLQGYLQDFSALYGGGVFGIFQDPSIAPQGELFDQSENNSEKLGLRLTWDGRPLEGLPIDLVTGVDLLRDRTFQSLAQTNRNWVPETTCRNSGPIAQADLDLAGACDPPPPRLRWDFASLDSSPHFNSIRRKTAPTLPAVRALWQGPPTFNQALFNVWCGGCAGWRGCGSNGTFAHGPIHAGCGGGVILRWGVPSPGTAVWKSFLSLEPLVETDEAWEFGSGALHRAHPLRMTVSAPVGLRHPPGPQCGWGYSRSLR